MKKSVKAITGLALGAGAAVLAAGEVMYQCVLNMDIQNWMASKGLFRNEEEEKFWAENEIYQQGLAWYDEIKPEILTIYSSLGRDMRADYIPAENPTDNWAIVIHGYSAKTNVMSHYAWKYHTLGYNVILPHMVGHDSDSVRYCSMGFHDKTAVRDWISYIVKQNPKAKILMHGVSMGSATTMLVTGEDIPSNVVCAIADCGYTSCWDEYVYQAKQMFHMPSIVVESANLASLRRKNFDFRLCAPIEAVKKSKTPTLFIHGADDDFVPYHMMKPLYESCTAPDKQMLTVPGSFHANAVFAGNELYWNTTEDFISRYF